MKKKKDLGLSIWLLSLNFLPMQGIALSFHVAVEYPRAPGCSAFAEKSKAVMEEWYPKIQDLNRLCAEGHCAADLFVSVCGKDVDLLWAEFTSDLRNRKPPDK